MAEHITTGQKGEALAEAYLKELGYKILGRNIANPYGKRLGELDIVAQQGKEVVFVEVKTLRERLDGDIWLPEWHVTANKLHKLVRIAEYYLRQKNLVNTPYRFDVIAITLHSSLKPEIKHIEHAFF